MKEVPSDDSAHENSGENLAEPVVHIRGFTVMREFGGDKTLQECLANLVRKHIDSDRNQ